MRDSQEVVVVERTGVHCGSRTQGRRVPELSGDVTAQCFLAAKRAHAQGHQAEAAAPEHQHTATLSLTLPLTHSLALSRSLSLSISQSLSLSHSLLTVSTDTGTGHDSWGFPTFLLALVVSSFVRSYSDLCSFRVTTSIDPRTKCQSSTCHDCGAIPVGTGTSLAPSFLTLSSFCSLSFVPLSPSFLFSPLAPLLPCSVALLLSYSLTLLPSYLYSDTHVVRSTRHVALEYTRTRSHRTFQVGSTQQLTASVSPRSLARCSVSVSSHWSL